MTNDYDNHNLISNVPSAQYSGEDYNMQNIRMDDKQLKDAIEEALSRKIIFQFEGPNDLAKQIMKNRLLTYHSQFINFVTYLIKIFAQDKSHNQKEYTEMLQYISNDLEQEIIRIKGNMIISQLESEGLMSNESS